ncbi:MAG: NAD(+) diphosphatase [Desulfuromonadales bacterium]|nr:MAG: NAD(+) diphosphatase [Desulfuromonadales bacterium]
MSRPETVNLPFNATVLADRFVPATQGMPDSGEPGIWAVIRGGALVVEQREGGLCLPAGERPAWLPAGADPVVIGRWEGRPLRAVPMAAREELPPSVVAEPFNASAERLDEATLTLGGMAQQVLHWERNSRCCPRCGAVTERISGGWGKRCVACDAEHFPHIHPCVIVLVRRGDEFLLARKPEWAPGRYGLVAGFLDMGESLEECVRREVREETGVEVTNIRYVGSQCWPFPSQLMAGFVADYAGGEIRVDATEIEDARWFCTDLMPPSIPPRRSIARWIIDHYALNLEES